MATITISQLRPAGTQFFSDPENFLNDLTDEATLIQISGGLIMTISILPINSNIDENLNNLNLDEETRSRLRGFWNKLKDNSFPRTTITPAPIPF